MLRNKLMTACSVAVLMAALYGCSSSSDDGANMQVQDLQDQIAALTAELGEGEELTPEALAALIQAKADAEAALADAMIAHQATLAAAAMDAETAKTAALAAAAMEAMTAHEAALAAAAMEAMTAQEAALAAAAMEAMTAQEAALAAAAMEAMTAHEAALAAAAMEAMTAREAALAAAAMEAMTAREAALAAAAMEAMTAREAALAAAAIAAADMAAADKAAALADAKTAADAAQAMALADAKTAADAAQAMALADAKTAADAAQAMALADAKTAADAAQAMALADAKTAADAAQVMALADAKTAADAAQAMALADAKTAADAALKMVQDDLDEFKRKNVAIIAANEAKEASDMAKAVLEAIGVDTALMTTGAPMVSLAASSAGDLTAKQLGYRDSPAPEEIAGWRGRTLVKDGDTTVIYTNIEDEVPTLLDGIYARASKLPGAPQTYAVTDDGGESTINWMDVKRADTSETETAGDPNPTTTFAGSVRGVDGTFSCTGAICTAPTPADGVISNGGTEWTFAPTNSGAMINVKDTAYVSFGWWLNKMGTQGAYEFDAFASVGMGMGVAVTARAADVVSGSATYRGAAAGKYAIQSTTDDSASGGHFTAAAKLTADFDASTDAEMPNTDGVSIGGTVTDFMTGDVSRPNWKVTLKAVDDVPMEVGPITDAETVWSTGGAVDGKGTWSANFYGEEEDTMQPTAAIGEFNAAIGGGEIENTIARISGAFAATKQ